MYTLANSIRFFDRFNLNLYSDVMREKKQPKKNTIKKVLNISKTIHP